MPRRSETQVAAARESILRTAVEEASVRGFESATIGQLAASLGMSKSGLIRHFGDKEQLQIATLRAGMEVFTEHVWRPAAVSPRGLPRLVALVESWIAFFERDVFPGGCLLTTASIEFDARQGPVHDVVADAMRFWLRVLEREIVYAVEQGQLDADVDPQDLAFTLNALASAASTSCQLHGDRAVLNRARGLMLRALAA